MKWMDDLFYKATKPVSVEVQGGESDTQSKTPEPTDLQSTLSQIGE